MPREDLELNSLMRICDILDTFNESQKNMTLTEICRQVKLPKSTTYRYLATLERHGLIYQAPNDVGYQLGYKLIHWGALAQCSVPIYQRAAHILHELTDETGETSVLWIRNGHAAVLLDQVESPQSVRCVKQIGARVLLHAGAAAKVLWAFLPEKEIEEILEHIAMAPLQPQTISDKDEMRAELKQIQKQGYATSAEETDRGVLGIAAPVFDYNGKLSASIGIIAPIGLMPPEKVHSSIATVKEAAHRLSRELGAE